MGCVCVCVVKCLNGSRWILVCGLPQRTAILYNRGSVSAHRKERLTQRTGVEYWSYTIFGFLATIIYLQF